MSNENVPEEADLDTNVDAEDASPTIPGSKGRLGLLAALAGLAILLPIGQSLRGGGDDQPVETESSAASEELADPDEDSPFAVFDDDATGDAASDADTSEAADDESDPVDDASTDDDGTTAIVGTQIGVVGGGDGGLGTIVIDGDGTDDSETPDSDATADSDEDHICPDDPAYGDDPDQLAMSDDSGDSFFNDSFDAESPDWEPLSGSWGVTDGLYSQTDGAGFDLISQLLVDPPEEFSVSVDMTATSDILGGGLIIGQPVPGTRNGAVAIDFTEGGKFVRWGIYDEQTGQYRYIGGVAIEGDFDLSATHNLAVEVRSSRTQVSVDGTVLGTFDAVEFGGVGVVTSVSSINFDNFTIVER